MTNNLTWQLASHSRTFIFTPLSSLVVWNKLNTPSLDSKKSCCVCPRPFVKMSANWWSVLTCSVSIIPFCIFSLIKWQSILMCFVLSWYIGFTAICMAALLSQNNFTGNVNFQFSSANKTINQITYNVALAMLLYSASAELLDMVLCFLDFQDINEFPSLTTKPLTDFLVMGKVGQSASQ